MFTISQWQRFPIGGFHAVVSIQSMGLHEEVFIEREALRVGPLHFSRASDQVYNMEIISNRIMAAIDRLLATSCGLSAEERDRRARDGVFGPDDFNQRHYLADVSFEPMPTVPQEASSILYDLHSTMQAASGGEVEVEVGLSDLGWSDVTSHLIQPQVWNERDHREALSALEARQVEEALRETQCPTIKRALRTMRNLP